MRIYNGEENFESFYLKHFDSLGDLQNCTECFKNLSIFSGSIYYQTQQFSTSSFNRIVVENDSWLDRTFWKNGGNSFTSSFSIGTLNNNLLSFLTSGSSRMVISSSGNVQIYNTLTVGNLIFDNNGTPNLNWNFTTNGISMGGGTIINSISLSTSTGSIVEFSTNGDILSYRNYTYLGTLKPSFGTPSIGQFLKANSTSSNSWSFISTGDVTGLNAFTSSINSVTGSYFLKVGGDLTGLGGSGSLGMFSQSVSPISQSNSSKIFVNSSNILSQIDNNGYITTITSLETSSTFASMSMNLKPRLILVNVDETNGSIPTIYLHDGVGLQWIPTNKLY